MQRRVLVALRPASPIERLFSVAAALSKHMDAELEILVDPTHPALDEIKTRFAALGRSLRCHLTTIAWPRRARPRRLRTQPSKRGVCRGRQAAWHKAHAARAWAKLGCPLVAACDHPGIPEEV